MILLDSDHLSVLHYHTGERASQLFGRLALAEADGPIGTTIVNIEEAMRGWLSAIAKERLIHSQISSYRDLAKLFGFFSGFHIALLEDVAVDHFAALRKSKLRVGTMDLKTAAIALAQDALLLTANRRDFELVPGLRFENWLD